MRNMILGYFTMMSLALIILIIMIVETGAITNFLTPVFATAGVTEAAIYCQALRRYGSTPNRN